MVVSIFGLVLLLQGGCEQQAKTQAQPVAEVAESLEEKTPEAKTPEASAVIEGGARIVFESQEHDFGEVGPKKRSVCEFNFTNVGDDVLKITKVSKTCGCTPFTLEKKEYVPGESGTLKVKYYSGQNAGPVTRRLYMFSNDAENPKVTLTIRALIVPKVKAEPKVLNLSLRKENAGCPPITLTSLDGRAFKITKVKTTADAINVDFNPNEESTNFVLQPKVDMEQFKQGLKGRIEFTLTHPDCSSVVVPFSALSEFTVKPPVLITLKAEPQKAIKREVWVLNNYDEDFEIESVSSKKGFVKVLKQEKVGNRYKLELEITPPLPDKNARLFTDQFLINIKDGGQLAVTCRGLYAKKK